MNESSFLAKNRMLLTKFASISKIFRLLYFNFFSARNSEHVRSHIQRYLF